MAARPDRMSDAEALMWNVEKDPFLSSNVGALSILDGPVDVGVLRNKLTHAVADLPRLRRRVEAGVGRLAPPTWVPDIELDLDHHLRVVGVPGGTGDDLLHLAALLLGDPMDRTRPLWQFFVLTGLDGGRSALLTKLHHTVTDGQGGVRLAERYMDAGPEPSDPGPLPLAEVLARPEPDEDGSLPRAALDVAAHTLRRNLGRARRAVGELAVTSADPLRVPEAGAGLVRGLGAAADELGPAPPGSPLWTARSRRRRFLAAPVAFRPVLDAARARGVSLNDLFVAAAVDGASRYHLDAGAPADHLNVTFVVSTRTAADSETSNAFTPTRVRLPAGPMEPADRLAEVSRILGERKTALGGPGVGLSDVAGIANLLPTSVVTRVARGQASGIDVATSNVRAAPFPVWVAGARVLATYPMGPVAGTAVNVTMLSYDGRLDLGFNVDPEAVAFPEELRDHVVAAFGDLVRAGGQQSEEIDSHLG